MPQREQNYWLPCGACPGLHRLPAENSFASGWNVDQNEGLVVREQKNAGKRLSWPQLITVIRSDPSGLSEPAECELPIDTSEQQIRQDAGCSAFFLRTGSPKTFSRQRRRRSSSGRLNVLRSLLCSVDRSQRSLSGLSHHRFAPPHPSISTLLKISSQQSHASAQTHEILGPAAAIH